ncbi:MAG: hypothetical protein FJX67_16870 [Alphaproteobacteria bacterium]|nr:hypothetical protein [Alphaproteobacteria bacterium]
MKLVFALLVLAVIGAPIALVVYGLDDRPITAKTGDLAFDDVRRGKELLQRADPRQMPADRVTTVRATDAEINAALSTALAAFWRASAGVAAGRNGVALSSSIELPGKVTMLGRYLNLHAVVRPSSSGLDIAQASIGRIELPPFLVKAALGFALDRALGTGEGDRVLASVTSVAVEGNRIAVGFRPPANLVADATRAAQRLLAVAEPAAVRAQLRRIQETAKTRGGPQSVSFAAFLAPAMKLAAERGGDPVAENRAALIALAIAFGDARFERLVGEVRASELGLPDLNHVRLEGRRDWVQHFTVSAGLVVAGGAGVANVIGEAKEVKDADGPSGFSFTDIGADRAGVRFAEAALASPEAARRVQAALAAAREADFFPRVGDLPEGLSEAEFKLRYADMTSAAYQAHIREIDRRLAAIALYR